MFLSIAGSPLQEILKSTQRQVKNENLKDFFLWESFAKKLIHTFRVEVNSNGLRVNWGFWFVNLKYFFLSYSIHFLERDLKENWMYDSFQDFVLSLVSFGFFFLKWLKSWLTTLKKASTFYINEFLLFSWEMQISKQEDFDTIFVASVVEGQRDRKWPFNPPPQHPITRVFCKINKKWCFLVPYRIIVIKNVEMNWFWILKNWNINFLSWFESDHIVWIYWMHIF